MEGPRILDLKRDLAPLYRAPAVPALVTVPPLTCLMVDGVGDPNTAPAYQDAVATLYAVSYGLRALGAGAGIGTWTVMPLEGLWWSDDPAVFLVDRRADWQWTMLIVQPPAVDDAVLTEALAGARRKGRAPAGDDLRLEVLAEVEAFHVLHHGPYADEGPKIAALHDAIADHGLTLRGKHHEVYLTDPRRSAPEKMRTILRQPVGR